jgi:hypothetical protein
MPIDDFERANPVVLHARLGAELARETYGVDDAAILSAIRKHTVAAENMSRLDVILYLADGIEPGRDYPERAGFVRLALRDLDAAMAAVLGSTIAYLGHRSLDVAPQTWAAARRLGVAVASVSAHDLETSSQMHATPPPAADSPAKGSTLPDLLSTVLAAAEDKKGEDLTVLDLDGRTIVADTFVIVTGRSKIQTRSIADRLGLDRGSRLHPRSAPVLQPRTALGQSHRGTGAIVVRQSTRSPRSRARIREAWLKAFVWIFIGIFLLGSVGAVALIAVH